MRKQNVMGRAALDDPSSSASLRAPDRGIAGALARASAGIVASVGMAPDQWLAIRAAADGVSFEASLRAELSPLRFGGFLWRLRRNPACPPMAD
jgi:hypothetical protein